MLNRWFHNYLKSRPCLISYNNSERKEARQYTHFILFPSNRWFNITLNRILDRPEWFKGILHNHPWFNISIILKGGYWEKTEAGVKWHGPGSIIFRSATKYHSIWIKGGKEAWTIFIHGPVKKGFDYKQDGLSIEREQISLPKSILVPKR